MKNFRKYTWVKIVVIVSIFNFLTFLNNNTVAFAQTARDRSAAPEARTIAGSQEQGEMPTIAAPEGEHQLPTDEEDLLKRGILSTVGGTVAPAVGGETAVAPAAVEASAEGELTEPIAAPVEGENLAGETVLHDAEAPILGEAPILEEAPLEAPLEAPSVGEIGELTEPIVAPIEGEGLAGETVIPEGEAPILGDAPQGEVAPELGDAVISEGEAPILGDVPQEAVNPKDTFILPKEDAAAFKNGVAELLLQSDPETAKIIQGELQKALTDGTIIIGLQGEGEGDVTGDALAISIDQAITTVATQIATSSDAKNKMLQNLTNLKQTILATPVSLPGAVVGAPGSASTSTAPSAKALESSVKLLESSVKLMETAIASGKQSSIEEAMKSMMENFKGFGQDMGTMGGPKGDFAPGGPVGFQGSNGPADQFRGGPEFFGGGGFDFMHEAFGGVVSEDVMKNFAFEGGPGRTFDRGGPMFETARMEMAMDFMAGVGSEMIGRMVTDKTLVAERTPQVIFEKMQGFGFDPRMMMRSAEQYRTDIASVPGGFAVPGGPEGDFFAGGPMTGTNMPGRDVFAGPASVGQGSTGPADFFSHGGDTNFNWNEAVGGLGNLRDAATEYAKAEFGYDNKNPFEVVIFERNYVTASENIQNAITQSIVESYASAYTKLLDATRSHILVYGKGGDLAAWLLSQTQNSSNSQISGNANASGTQILTELNALPVKVEAAVIADVVAPPPPFDPEIVLAQTHIIHIAGQTPTHNLQWDEALLTSAKGQRFVNGVKNSDATFSGLLTYLSELSINGKLIARWVGPTDFKISGTTVIKDGLSHDNEPPPPPPPDPKLAANDNTLGHGFRSHRDAIGAQQVHIHNNPNVLHDVSQLVLTRKIVDERLLMTPLQISNDLLAYAQQQLVYVTNADPSITDLTPYKNQAIADANAKELLFDNPRIGWFNAHMEIAENIRNNAKADPDCHPNHVAHGPEHPHEHFNDNNPGPDGPVIGMDAGGPGCQF